MYVFGSRRHGWRERCEWMRVMGLGFTSPVLGLCLCLGCGGVDGVGGGSVDGMDQGMEGRCGVMCV